MNYGTPNPGEDRPADSRPSSREREAGGSGTAGREARAGTARRAGTGRRAWRREPRREPGGRREQGGFLDQGSRRGDGLIERHPDPADRRARLLSVTPEGHRPAGPRRPGSSGGKTTCWPSCRPRTASYSYEPWRFFPPQKGKRTHLTPGRRGLLPSCRMPPQPPERPSEPAPPRPATPVLGRYPPAPKGVPPRRTWPISPATRAPGQRRSARYGEKKASGEHRPPACDGEKRADGENRRPSC